VSVQSAMLSNPTLENAFPQHLVEPTYQNRLRVLGRFIDEHRLHSITLIEIPGGFVLRGMRDSDPWPVLIEFGDRKIAKVLRKALDLRGSAPIHRETRDLIPTGYEDVLRALGFELDQRIAENIVIAELPSILVVSGFEPILGYGESSYQPFSDPLGPEDTIEIVRRAVARRGTYQHIQTYIPPNFRG
jgi:hypothetical protein